MKDNSESNAGSCQRRCFPDSWNLPVTSNSILRGGNRSEVHLSLGVVQELPRVSPFSIYWGQWARGSFLLGIGSGVAV